MKCVVSVFGWLVVAALCLAPTSGRASEADEPELEMSVPEVFVISVDQGHLEFDATPQELIDQETAPQTLVATVQSNTDWVVNIYGDSAIWTGPWDKPVGDILWRISGGTYAPLETSNANVSSGGPTAGSNLEIEIKISLDITEDLPGNYEYESIILEISAP